MHNSGDIYGASRSLLRLLSHVDRNKFLYYIVLPEHGPLEARLKELGEAVFVQPKLSVISRQVFYSWRIFSFLFFIPYSVLQLWSFIIRHRIQIVHSNTGVIISPSLAAKLSRRVHIWHIRDWFQEFKPIWKVYSWYILWSSRFVICVSKAVASQFKQNSKIRVIYNGFSSIEFDIDHKNRSREFREKQGLGDDLVVGTVGRIKFLRKGQETFVRAAKLLLQNGAKVKFIIVGTAFPGNEDHLIRLQALIEELNLKNDVILAGELADPRPAYAAMDVFVLPSGQPEPFGGVVLEAMAMGLPVVATNIGGSVEQVLDGATGYLVEPNNEVELAHRIQFLLEHPATRTTFGVAGQERVRSLFNLQKSVQEIEMLYITCIPE